MQVVIDIPDELYNYINSESYDVHLDMRFDFQIRHSVQKGIPLTKGHGRIGDLDAVMSDIKNSVDKMTDMGIIVDGQWLWEKLNDALYNAKPIIEADKENTE